MAIFSNYNTRFVISKSFSLVLALVFILGLCTFGTNAVYAGYTDIAKITEEYMDAVP